MSLKDRLTSWFASGDKAAAQAGENLTPVETPTPVDPPVDTPAPEATPATAPQTGGDSLAECAALEGSGPRCRVLLAAGHDPLQRDSDGRTPLHIAAQHGNLGVLEVLCEEVISVDPYDNFRVSPLMTALRSTHPKAPDAAQFLIKKGASLTLNVAFALGDLQLINRLFSENRNASKSCKAPDDLLTDLAVAIGRECRKKRAAKGHPTDEAMVAAIESEVIDRYVPITQRVVDLGCHPDAFNVAGRPALFDAVQFSSTLFAEALLKLGADPNFQTEAGETPLNVAGGDRPAMQALLMEHGAQES